jgi:hypothetical protein
VPHRDSIATDKETMMSIWKVTVTIGGADSMECFDMDGLFDGLGAFDWDAVERVTIEPSTEDAKATHLHNSLLGVTLSRDLEKDTDA